jgi:hypothetical protein
LFLLGAVARAERGLVSIQRLTVLDVTRPGFSEINAMPALQVAHDHRRDGLLKVAAGGLVTGVLTPLCQLLIDRMVGSPGDIRIALLATPFAILVFILVGRNSANRWWAALAAAIVTMVAFVGAVNAAVWVDGQIPIDAKPMRNVSSGFVGGFTGSTIMALGICLLPAGPRDVAAWLPMLIIGTVAGALLAVDSLLELDLLSVLYPVWQAGVAIGLTLALRQAEPR